MYDAYFEQRGLIPEGRLCEVGYEDLERDPVGVVGSVYEALGLPGFEDVRPRLEGYLGSIAGYRKNRLRRAPRAATASHRPRVGPELRRVGLPALTDLPVFADRCVTSCRTGRIQPVLTGDFLGLLV